ncbi:MAG: MBL fold metallo-hydrolase [Cetobacterium sp.]|uniref:MBL fold metallo-hydrolase n=1 Tax=Cetobacterium sp. TaxID=2071632 RepID=UPI003F29FB79
MKSNLNEINNVQIQLLRNATMKIKYNKKIILTDPLLAPKNSYHGYLPENKDKLVSPTSDLPFSAEKIVKDIDLILVSHTHIPESGKVDFAYSDHFDQKAIEIIDKNTPIFVQESDSKGLKTVGFNNLVSFEKTFSWEGISFERFELLHTDILSLKPVVGEVSGYILRADNQPTILWAGDTILTQNIKDKITEVQPDIIIIHPAKAHLLLSEAEKDFFNSLGMTINKDINELNLLIGAEEAIEIAKLAPKAKIVAVHMESTDHSTVTRKDLKEKIKAAGVTNIIVPDNGEILRF